MGCIDVSQSVIQFFTVSPKMTRHLVKWGCLTHFMLLTNPLIKIIDFRVCCCSLSGYNPLWGYRSHFLYGLGQSGCESCK